MTKFLFDERWPRTIVGTSPVTVTTSGLTTTVAINTGGALSEGLFDVWLKIYTDDFTVERVYGRLPICEGI